MRRAFLPSPAARSLALIAISTLLPLRHTRSRSHRASRSVTTHPSWGRPMNGLQFRADHCTLFLLENVGGEHPFRFQITVRAVIRGAPIKIRVQPRNPLRTARGAVGGGGRQGGRVMVNITVRQRHIGLGRAAVRRGRDVNLVHLSPSHHRLLHLQRSVSCFLPLAHHHITQAVGVRPNEGVEGTRGAHAFLLHDSQTDGGRWHSRSRRSSKSQGRTSQPSG